jgi:F-type H+-transporting ATPase subunit delta
MQAASRESYSAAAQRLSAYAQGAQPPAIAQVADEILAVGRLLAREPRLRRALADSARTSESRAELLRAVLAGKVGDDTLDLLAGLVQGRWSSAGDKRPEPE